MHNSKQAALQAAKKQLGARAVEGMDFVIRRTTGWTVEPVKPANAQAALAQAERISRTHPLPSQFRAAEAERIAAEPRAITSPNRSAGAKSGHPRRRTKQPAKPAAPEGQTKTELLAEMMTRPNGATSKEMERATGWEPHSVRGLIGMLKKRGVRIESLKEAGGGPTRYKVTEARGAEPVQDVGDVL